MPLLDGTPVLMCLSCHRVDTATTWESRSAAGLDRGSPEGQACHADVLLAIANEDGRGPDIVRSWPSCTAWQQREEET